MQSTTVFAKGVLHLRAQRIARAYPLVAMAAVSSLLRRTAPTIVVWIRSLKPVPERASALT